MSTEIELKLLIAPQDARPLLRHPFITALTRQKFSPQRLLSIYYDTADCMLHKQRIALRLRRIGRHWIQTVKTEGRVIAGLHERSEWECKTTKDTFVFHAIADPILRELFADTHLQHALQPVFVTEFSRTRRMLELPSGDMVESHLTRRERKRCKFACMKAQSIADLYADYLLASFGATTATGLSQLLEGEVSHDRVTRSLAGEKKTAADLWRTVKAFVRQVQSEAGVLIIDDSIEEKPYTDENDIVCGHYDHSKDRVLKGINFLTALYSSQGVSLPVGFHLVAKTEKYTDPKTQKEKRRSPVSKNAVCQEVSKQAVTNRLPFRFVLFDVWFASAATLLFIKQQQQRDFICPLKTNRKVAVRVADTHQGRDTRVDTLELQAHASKLISLDGVDFPLVLVKQVFPNEDGSVGIRYLVSSDTTLSVEDLTTTSHARWQVEGYHQSLKQNVSLAKSPTQTVTTQTNHFFAALGGFIKLERLKMGTKLNHFALKSKLYLNALRSAFSTLRTLTPVQGSA